MARMESQMIPLGTKAPDFSLVDAVTGKTVSLGDFDGAPATLVMFICNHCPFVKHVADELARLGRDAGAKGVAVVAISANDVANYPDDAPDKMKLEAEARGYDFPYLFDESQDVARAYGAVCTPDFFLFDRDHALRYRGRLDATRPGGANPDGRDLRAAIEAVSAGQPAPEPQLPSVGCSIKWRV